MAKTTFKLKSRANLMAFLKRFSPIEKNLLLEIHKDSLQAKSNTQDRSVVKFSKMPLQDVLEGTVPADLVKVPIYDVGRLAGVFKHFADTDEISIDLEHEIVGADCLAMSLTFRNTSTKVKILTGDVTLFNFITDDMVKKIIKRTVDEKTFEFPFPKDAYSKLSSLCSMDGPKDPLSIIVDNGQVVFRGKSFEHIVGDAPAGPAIDFEVFTEHFSMIEHEISTFVMSPTKMVVKSQESSTVTIVGRVDHNKAN